MDERTVRFFGGKKFMWDGVEYETEEAAKEKAKEYSDKGFEVELKEESGKYLVYTRRVVTEIVVEGASL